MRPGHIFSSTNGHINDISRSSFAGAGGIFSTPAELIVFEDALLKGKLMSAKSLALMKSLRDSGFGMGMMAVPFYKRIGYGHGGDTFGTHSLLASYPADSLSIAYSINGQVYPHKDISIAILKICFNDSLTIPFQNPVISKKLLQQYSGVYTCPDLPLKATVTYNDTTMFLQLTGQPIIGMDAVTEKEFKIYQVSATLTFDTAREEMKLDQGGKTFVFTKQR